MTIMSDNWIKKMSVEEGMIEPFVDAQKKEGTISYGVSSYGVSSYGSSGDVVLRENVGFHFLP